MRKRTSRSATTRPALDGRDFLVDAVYLIFIEWQCEAFFAALDRALGRTVSSPQDRAITNLSSRWQAISDFHSALTAASNVKKMLWPEGFRNKAERTSGLARAARLRKLLRIRAEREPRVLKVASVLRNDLEHADSRLDEWAAEMNLNAFVSHAVWRDLRSFGVTDRLGRWNPETGILQMFGRKVNATRLEAAIFRIWVRAAVGAKSLVALNASLLRDIVKTVSARGA